MKTGFLSTLPSVLAVLAGTLFFTGCETTAPAGNSHASSGGPSTKIATTSAVVGGASSVAEGRKIYFGRCTACHAPEPVLNYTLAEWREILPDMGDESKLNGQQRAALSAYVKSFY